MTKVNKDPWLVVLEGGVYCLKKVITCNVRTMLGEFAYLLVTVQRLPGLLPFKGSLT